jgi:hypothetical protein
MIEFIILEQMSMYLRCYNVTGNLLMQGFIGCFVELFCGNTFVEKDGHENYNIFVKCNYVLWDKCVCSYIYVCMRYTYICCSVSDML